MPIFSSLPRRVLACICLPVALQAQAQVSAAPITYPPVVVLDKVQDYRQFNKVEITGSAILAKEAKEALPIQVIDQREIERSGAATLSQLIPKLSVMSNFQESGFTQGTALGGLDSAAIHGNESGTLILLNGRRLPYYGLQTLLGDKALVDLNVIPLAAVEKIEILTSGASSRYGSDAVAGVMNIITKSQAKGWTLNVDHAQPEKGGASKSASLTWGEGQLASDGYSVRTYLTLANQDLVAAGDRSVTGQGAKAFTIDGQTYWRGTFYSPYAAPALNYIQNGITQNITAKATGKCPESWYLIAGLCQRNTQPAMTLYPQVNKAQAYVQAEKMLPDGWQFFVEGLHTRYNQEFIPDGTYYPHLVEINDKSYYWEAAPLGLLRQRYSNQISNLSAGVKGVLSGWDIQASTSAGQHAVQRNYIQGTSTSPNWRNIPLTEAQVLQSPSDYSTQTWSQFSPFIETAGRFLDKGHTDFRDIGILASREIMESEHGPVSFGAGINLRTESVAYVARQASNNFDARRQIAALYGELQWPVSDQLESTLSARHDRYSDFGSVNTGKAALKWRPSSAWMWRASAGTGFRAPTLGQLVPLEKMVAGASYEGTDYNVYNAGNPHLKPERSLQTMLGFRYEPDTQWTLGADLWDLRIKDSFGFRDTNLIFTTPELFSRYVQGTNIYSPNENLGQSKSRGVDYDLQWRYPTDIGRWRLSLKGTHYLKSERTSASTSQGFDSNLGVYSETLGSAIPRNQLTASAFLEKSTWLAGLALNFRSGRKEQVNVYNDNDEAYLYKQRVPDFWTLDFMGRWQISNRLNLSAAVENLTNNFPPFLLQTANNLNGVDTRFASYLGRTWKMRAQYKF